MVLSVLKALDILVAAAESPGGIRLNDITESLGLKKTTAHNLVRTLRARGFLEKDSANRFCAGPAIQALAQKYYGNKLLAAAEAGLRRMAAEIPEATLTFTELTPGAILTRLRMSPDRPGEVQRPNGLVVMPYITATAVCLQATAANALEYEEKMPFEEYGAGAWGSPGKFNAAKERARRDGYAAASRNGRFSIVFPVPENHALGINVTEPGEARLKQIKRRAKHFVKTTGKHAP